MADRESSFLGEMRRMDKSLDANDWQPGSLFGDVTSSALPDLMRVMLQLPQIKDSIDHHHYYTWTGSTLVDCSAHSPAANRHYSFSGPSAFAQSLFSCHVP